MNRLKRWWIAYKLLKKYNLGYRPTGGGTYRWFDCGKRPQIEINPFQNNFFETFSHELGHHLFHKIFYLTRIPGDTGWYKSNLVWYMNGADIPVNKVIHEEACACATIIGIRIAKALGITLDRGWLFQQFHTYTGAAYSYMSKNCVDREYLTEVVSVLSLKIHKT
jgi:hypothetical protein